MIRRRPLLVLVLLLPLLLAGSCGEDAPPPAERETEGGPTPAPTPTPDPPAPAPTPTVPDHVLLAQDLVFGDVAAAEYEIYANPSTPTWFRLRLDKGGLASVPVGPPPGLKDDTPLSIEVVAYRTHTGPIAIDVLWGEQRLGTLRSEPELKGGRVVLRMPLTHAQLPRGTANLDLKDASPALPRRERNDVTDDRGTIWIDSIRIGGPGSPAGPRPTVDQPELSTGGVEHVILATPELFEEARRLSAHRSADGLSSAVIRVSETHPLTEAGIRRLAASEGLRYLVLAGDATYDRTDLIDEPTIPTPMARTKYNGATSADPLYLSEGSAVSIGRLPFRKAAEMKAYVDRLIAYETSPPAHPSRNLLRFVTNEGRFGALIDNMIENLFRRVLAEAIAPAYDVEVTFASATSRNLWPPREMNQKVVDSFNEGSLFFTYVGHGYQFGFDNLRVQKQHFPVLHAKHTRMIETRGTPPIAFIIACTTAQFDDPKHDGIGELLLKRPKGPIAYWGATRVCHPVANSVVGYTMARATARPNPPERIGDLIREAWDAASIAAPEDRNLKMIRLGAAVMAGGIDVNQLITEGRQMYSLLGDPALRIAYPRADLVLTRVPGADESEIVVELSAPLPDGTKVRVTLEATRDQRIHDPVRVPNILDPRYAPLIRENHRLANDWTYATLDAVLADGRATVRFKTTPERKALVVKAVAMTPKDLHHGGLLIPAPARQPK